MRGTICLALLVLSVTIAFAGELPPTAGAEIDALLSRLEASGCQFYRNGTWHTGAEAKDHLRLKLDYLIKHGRVASAEEFIEKAGTKSSLSKRPYKVACPGQEEQPSAVWLGAALRASRESGLVTPGRGAGRRRSAWRHRRLGCDPRSERKLDGLRGRTRDTKRHRNQ